MEKYGDAVPKLDVADDLNGAARSLKVWVKPTLQRVSLKQALTASSNAVPDGAHTVS
jgi:hypothetical protein